MANLMAQRSAKPKTCRKCGGFDPAMGTTKYPWSKSMPMSTIDPEANDDEFYRKVMSTPLCSLCRAELQFKTPTYTGSSGAGGMSRYENRPEKAPPYDPAAHYIPEVCALEQARIDYEARQMVADGSWGQGGPLPGDLDLVALIVGGAQ